MSTWWEELRDQLAPFVWPTFTHTTTGYRNSVEVAGSLRADGLAPGASEREVRGHLYAQAERAIETVEGLGYRHLSAPRIDLSGQVTFKLGPHEEGPRPVLLAEGCVRLSLWRADL